MAHVLVAGKLHPAGRAVLEDAAGITAHFVEEISEESYAPFIHEADALLIRTQPLSEKTIAAATRLRIVSRHGVGYDAVDVAALSNRSIALAVCGDVNSRSVAEHAVMMILAASKRALRADGAVRRGPWTWRNSLESRDLRGQNLLILGYGRIGRHTAELMASFGMTIRAHDPYLAKAGWPQGAAGPAPDLDEALSWADVISISAPKGEGALIGAAQFARMKDGVVVVNTARGGLVDEAALVAALGNGKVGAAGLDVFEDEPVAPDHPLCAFDQVILSPHIAGVTEGAAIRMAVQSAQTILDYLAGKADPDLIINRKAIADVLPT